MPSLPRFLFALAASCLAADGPAQDDLRDHLERKDGRKLSGRLVEPWANGELTLLQGGQRVRIDRGDLARIDLVGDRLAQVLERRAQMQNAPRAQRYVVDEAVAAELPDLARLLAMDLVLHDQGDDEDLRKLLGHRRNGKNWLWPHDGKWLTLEKLEAALAKDPIRLVGERFALRCSAGLAANVKALIDLERLGAVWFQRFGADLGMREVLQRIEIETFRNGEDFPKWGFRPRPWFEPPPHADRGRTFYAGPRPARPELLFFLGTQGLIYRTMAGETNRQDSRDRVAAWLEIGLGMYMEHTMQGPAGFAAPGDPIRQDLAALQALARGYRLTHLLHLPMYTGFYLTDDSPTATNWCGAEMLVTWLLRDDNQPATRAPFLRFVHAALVERKGDSSTAFDQIMGRRIEELESPWVAWLNATAGN